MSLWVSMQTPCVMLERVRQSDGEGGFVTKWSEAAEFEAAITRDSSIEARVAEKQGVDNVYTVTTTANLKFGDVFRRKSDGQCFRATSNADDGRTPSMVTFQFNQLSAEEWEVPDGD